ncbi:LysR family transcriptional regulator [Streptococcus sanguinis SK72]|uniref:LysR family transcriptional regulator n=1 Tax=Streptococcus sanguinis SK72 TaxID=888809 RepID=F0I4U0_STRSA|nr:LysR family transcriptional regulator [Streptococcus sanguinis SK72]
MFEKIAGKRNKFALLSLISEQSVNKRYFPIGRYTENQFYVRMPRFITNPMNLAVLKFKFLNLKDIPKKKSKVFSANQKK